MAEKTKKQVNDAIMLLMYSDDPKERKDSAAFLVGVIDRRIVPQIVQAAKHEKDSSVKYFLTKELALLKGNFGDLDAIVAEIKSGGDDDILKNFAPKTPAKNIENKYEDDERPCESDISDKSEDTESNNGDPDAIDKSNEAQQPENGEQKFISDADSGKISSKQAADEFYNSFEQKQPPQNNEIIIDNDILNALDDFQREFNQENKGGAASDKSTVNTAEVDEEILKILASEGLSNLIVQDSPAAVEKTADEANIENENKSGNFDIDIAMEPANHNEIEKSTDDIELNLNEPIIESAASRPDEIINSLDNDLNNSAKFLNNSEKIQIEGSKVNFIIAELEKLPFDKSIKMDPMTLIEISKITEIIRRNKTNFLPELIEKLKTDDNPYIIAALVSAIGDLGDKTHAPIIIPFLNNRDTRVIANAIEALEKLGDSSYLEYMFKGVLHPDSRVKTNAIKAIWKFTQKDSNSDQAIMIKLENMAMSNRSEIYNPAIYVLGEIGNNTAISALERIAANAERSVSIKALETIQKIKDTRLDIPHEFLEVQISDGNSGTSNANPEEESQKSPNTVTQNNIDNPKNNISLIKGLEEAFSNSPEVIDAVTRKEITRLQEMTNLKNEDCLNQLVKELPQAKNQYVLATIISAIGNLGFAGSMENLLPFLDNADDRVVANTVEALGKIENSQCVNHIVKLIMHPDNRIKANVIKVLWKYTQSNKFAAGMIISRLREMLNSFKPDMRESAIYVLSEIATPEAIALIEYALNDKLSVIRIKAQQMLEKAQLTARKRNIKK